MGSADIGQDLLHGLARYASTVQVFKTHPAYCIRDNVPRRGVDEAKHPILWIITSG